MVQVTCGQVIISIHALREEGDWFFRFSIFGYLHFYPRPPRGGRRMALLQAYAPKRFLSTPSARRATFFFGAYCQCTQFLSTPSARRATRTAQNRTQPNQFLSTPSARRATFYQPLYRPKRGDFYPRPPRGGRRTGSPLRSKSHQFLSTPSARRATAKTERKYSAFVSLYTSLHKLQRGLCKASRKITPLLAQSTVIPVRSIPETPVYCLFALAGHQKISTLSCANSGCSPTCSTLVW